MSKTFTKAEKTAYFNKLRQLWAEASELAKDQAYISAHAEAQKMGVAVSIRSFCLVSKQMQNMQLQGVPYVDTKTFSGWNAAGFQVKKGEKSRLSSIVFIESKSSSDEKAEDEQKEAHLFPKKCHLFHSSQVEPITL